MEKAKVEKAKEVWKEGGAYDEAEDETYEET